MHSVLDICCGPRMMYNLKSAPYAIYGDIRQEDATLCDGRKLKIQPDIIFDFRRLPFKDQTFSLVIFDPPHLERAGEKSWQRAKYGILPDWRLALRQGFSEAWRVLRPAGTLVFKWNECHVPLSEIALLFPAPPLLGQRAGAKSKTIWQIFHKPAPAQEPRLFTRLEAAARLGISRTTADKLIKEGRLRGRRIGRQWRFTEADLNRALEDA